MTTVRFDDAASRWTQKWYRDPTAEQIRAAVEAMRPSALRSRDVHVAWNGECGEVVAASGAVLLTMRKERDAGGGEE